LRNILNALSILPGGDGRRSSARTWGEAPDAIVSRQPRGPVFRRAS
jgi:hypothetical protein